MGYNPYMPEEDILVNPHSLQRGMRKQTRHAVNNNGIGTLPMIHLISVEATKVQFEPSQDTAMLEMGTPRHDSAALEDIPSTLLRARMYRGTLFMSNLPSKRHLMQTCMRIVTCWMMIADQKNFLTSTTRT